MSTMNKRNKRDAQIAANRQESEIRRNYTVVCRCEWEDHGYDEVIVATSKDCVIHGEVDDPLDDLLAERDELEEQLVIVREKRDCAVEALREIAGFDIGVRLAPVAACMEIAQTALAKLTVMSPPRPDLIDDPNFDPKGDDELSV